MSPRGRKQLKGILWDVPGGRRRARNAVRIAEFRAEESLPGVRRGERRVVHRVQEPRSSGAGAAAMTRTVSQATGATARRRDGAQRNELLDTESGEDHLFDHMPPVVVDRPNDEMPLSTRVGPGGKGENRPPCR